MAGEESIEIIALTDFTCRGLECDFLQQSPDLDKKLSGTFCEQVRYEHVSEVGINRLGKIIEDYQSLCPLAADAKLEIG